MSLPNKVRGIKVLKAVSSPLRLQVLNLLFDKGALSYTELMTVLKMNPSRDAGKFAYHLKFLLKADLVEADVESKKYLLTDLGKMVIDVADRVEKKAFRQKGMIVRTSHSTLEMFEANKIADSLIKEAKMPAELAQKTAKEAEKLLIKSKTKYLTAPLVRELVNALLVEKGLEDYRHKLTRLGMPVHEVSALLEGKTSAQGAGVILTKAGGSVLSEYTLLNVFPRDISDAHVSGAIHVSGLETWLLKPEEVIHDVRVFLQHGLRPMSAVQHEENAPENLESALAILSSVLLRASSEVNRMQTCLYLNVFLAPFAKEKGISEVKRSLLLFVLNIHQHVEATFQLSLAIPEFVAEKEAIGPQGKICGKYGDFGGEALLIAQLILEVFQELSLQKPLLNPRIIVEISDETLCDEAAKNLLLAAHKVSAEKGTIYFQNIKRNEKRLVFFSGIGCKYQDELTGDWETDVLRTGCMGVVSINIPRIVQESERDKSKFLELLKERFELAARALEIKQRAVRQHGKTILPFLGQSANGDAYFRIDNCSNIINLVGLSEAVSAFMPADSRSSELPKLMGEIAQIIQSSKSRIGRKHGRRLFAAILPSQSVSERLAQLDIEKFGLAKVIFSGDREKPFYSTVSRFKVEGSGQLKVSALSTEIPRAEGLSSGGDLAIAELADSEHSPEELMNLTVLLANNRSFEFFTYKRRISYCSNCERSYVGAHHKCPVCGAVSSLTVFDRFNYT